MTNSSGSSQCDPELAIPDIFWDMETNPSYQAIGSERQIFSISVNKTYNQKRFRQQQNNQSKQPIHEIGSFTYPGVLRQTVTGQTKVILNFLSFFLIGDCDVFLNTMRSCIVLNYLLLLSLFTIHSLFSTFPFTTINIYNVLPFILLYYSFSKLLYLYILK